jgi:formylglycine-generating enzyme required for sulfatase activity
MKDGPDELDDRQPADSPALDGRATATNTVPPAHRSTPQFEPTVVAEARGTESGDAKPAPGGSAPDGESARRTEPLPTNEAAPLPSTVNTAAFGLKPGELFLGKYEIVRQIGSGGMGTVYLARHTSLDSHVAIKLMHVHQGQNAAAIERFKREARSCAQVEHPNAVRVFDFGEEHGNCYLVMEYLPGESLKTRLSRRGALPLEEVIPFAAAVCDVLGVMHRKRIVHRDLKPDNIIFRQQDEHEIVKVLDFGVVKLAESTQPGSPVTRTGAIIGTPMYMSPEQCEGREVDGAADIYSLGVMLYQMLSGQLPFVSDNLLTLMYLHVNQPPKPLSEAAPDVPHSVSDVVMRMLAKKPADRFDTPYATARALSQASGIPIFMTGSGWLGHYGVGTATPSEPMPAAADTILRDMVPERIDAPIGPERRAGMRASTLGWIAGTLVLVASAAATGALLLPTREGEINTPGPAPKATPGPDFVLVPAGTATIGRDVDYCKDKQDANCLVNDYDAPEHQLSLGAFYLSKYEVTNREYQEFVAAAGHEAPKGWNGASCPAGSEEYPVVNVTWFDAIAYCDWRSRRDGVDYRLPTEEEWEYAARGTDGRRYPWGDIFNKSKSNWGEKAGEGSPTSVKEAPNATSDVSFFQIYAMAGNVSEWTASQAKLYPGGSSGKKIDSEWRIVRGGSFNTKSTALQTHFRSGTPPRDAEPDVGFRLAVSSE